MIKAFLFDLDGVFVDNHIIPGGDIAIEWLKQNKIFTSLLLIILRYLEKC